MGYLLILAAVAVYGVIHSLLASLGVKAAAARWLGQTAVDRFYRLAYNLFAVAALLPVLWLAAAVPDPLGRLYSVPAPWRWLFLAIQGLALVLGAWAVLQTGALSFGGLRQLWQPRPPNPVRLQTGGLYRVVRHPIYFAGLLFMLFSPQMTGNQLALYLGFAGYFIAGAVVEERKLLVEFGAAYAAYRRRTPMLIPFLW